MWVHVQGCGDKEAVSGTSAWTEFWTAGAEGSWSQARFQGQHQPNTYTIENQRLSSGSCNQCQQPLEKELSWEMG